VYLAGGFAILVLGVKGSGVRVRSTPSRNSRVKGLRLRGRGRRVRVWFVVKCTEMRIAHHSNVHAQTRACWRLCTQQQTRPLVDMHASMCANQTSLIVSAKLRRAEASCMRARAQAWGVEQVQRGAERDAYISCT
jgi:hypothetical protein